MEETISRIKEYVKIFNPKQGIDEAVINLELMELVNRILIYIKRDELPKPLEITVAKAYNKNKELEKKIALLDNGGISSISDNGQSISYKSLNDSVYGREKELSILGDIYPILDEYKVRKIYITGEELDENIRRN